MQMREILQKELDFYNQAFQNISNTTAVLGGFAFGGAASTRVGRGPSARASRTFERD